MPNDHRPVSGRAGAGGASRREFLKVTATAAAVAGVVAVAGGVPQAAGGAADAARTGGPIDVGSERQLFFDSRFIAAADNVAITMNPPVKRGPVLKPDKRWEDFRFTSYFTVVQDRDRARMYYSCFSEDQWNTPDSWDKHAFLCYAESTDGINWEKPELGIVEFDGSKRNNILLKSVVDGTVFIDPTATPDRRYKLLHTVGPHKGGLRVSYSADGIHFTVPEQPVIGWTPDSQQNAFYDPRIEKYVAYLRARPDMGIEPKNRSVVRVEVADIEQPWTNVTPKLVFSTDELDPPDVDFYTNAGLKYPYAQETYLFFPAAYHHFDRKYGNDGLLDTSAAVSRDGIQWHRPDRGPYVPLGEAGAWDESFIMMGVGLVRRGDKLYQYYNGIDISHGGTRAESKESAQGRRRWGWMGLAEQRLDGFYSADFAYTGGSLLTPPIIFRGNALVLNLNTSAAGSAKVALLDENDRPLPGYGIDDCDEIITNNVAHVVTWKGQSDVSAGSGKPVRLKVAARSTKLFAFGFSPESGKSPEVGS